MRRVHQQSQQIDFLATPSIIPEARSLERAILSRENSIVFSNILYSSYIVIQPDIVSTIYVCV